MMKHEFCEKAKIPMEALSDEDYEAFVEWHLKTCEKPEILGTTCHVLYICKKLNDKN